MPNPAMYSVTSPIGPSVRRPPHRKPTSTVVVTTITTRNHAVNSGPTTSDERGDGAMRNRSKNPLSMSQTVENPSPTPAKPEPMQQASGRYQFTERSVGKPGILVMAKNVP